MQRSLQRQSHILVWLQPCMHACGNMEGKIIHKSTCTYCTSVASSTTAGLSLGCKISASMVQCTSYRHDSE